LEYDEKVRQFEARMNTLKTELEGNLNVCEFIFKNQNDMLKGTRFPQNNFYFPMLDGVLRSGEIINNDLLVALYSAHHYMMLSQKIIDQTINLEHQKVLVNPDKDILKRSRKKSKEQMGFLIKNTQLAQDFLQSSLDKLQGFRKEYIKRLAAGK
jgi:hypothetical protein